MKQHCRSILIVIMIFFSGLSLLSYNNNSQQTLINSARQIETVSRQQLDELFAKKSKFFLYVGRPTCPACEIFYPELEKIALSANQRIYYYNTEVKASQKSEMKDYMKQLEIQNIPVVLKVENGKIVEYYDGQQENDIDKFAVEVQGE